VLIPEIDDFFFVNHGSNSFNNGKNRNITSSHVWVYNDTIFVGIIYALSLFSRFIALGLKSTVRVLLI
jgi:hypothetical protein